MVMSLLGSFTYGYFFAFHLFDIVNVNQLLQGVIRAVTLNGKCSKSFSGIIKTNIVN